MNKRKMIIAMTVLLGLSVSAGLAYAQTTQPAKDEFKPATPKGIETPATPSTADNNAAPKGATTQGTQ